MAITKKSFGKKPCGCPVDAYVLENGSCLSVQILNLGGILTNMWVKNAAGEVADVICGFDNVDGYLTSGGYQGALIGRVGNRLANGKFTLEGKEYTLFCNDGPHSLHGGKNGFNAKLWDVEPMDDAKNPALVLTYVSKDGEEGYPGTLTVKVTYTLLEEGALSIHYEATTDKTTIISMTNHSYFNLAGYANGVVDDHMLWLDCDRINAVDSNLLPDGNFIDVTGTPYDFRTEKKLGEGFADPYPMMQEFGGYDNNFLFCGESKAVELRGILRDPASGRTMKMYTDQPCVQIYTANMIDTNDPAFKNGVQQYKHCGVCMETQAMPNSINLPGFEGNMILQAGDKYDKTTIYQFGE